MKSEDGTELQNLFEGIKANVCRGSIVERPGAVETDGVGNTATPENAKEALPVGSKLRKETMKYLSLQMPNDTFE